MQGNLWVRIRQHMCKRTCDSFTACVEFIKIRQKEEERESRTVGSILVHLV